jgi:hypothetical protein
VNPVGLDISVHQNANGVERMSNLPVACRMNLPTEIDVLDVIELKSQDRLAAGISNIASKVDTGSRHEMQDASAIRRIETAVIDIQSGLLSDWL